MRKSTMLLGALAALTMGFGFSAGLHHDKWLHIDSAHFMVGTADRYVDVWHSSDDGGIKFRLTDRVCAGSALSEPVYIDWEC